MFRGVVNNRLNLINTVPNSSDAYFKSGTLILSSCWFLMCLLVLILGDVYYSLFFFFSMVALFKKLKKGFEF